MHQKVLCDDSLKKTFSIVNSTGNKTLIVDQTINNITSPKRLIEESIIKIYKNKVLRLTIIDKQISSNLFERIIEGKTNRKYLYSYLLLLVGMVKCY